ncbi:unnamed protein product [Linum tenue]|uniref:Uncharacterized protein n=1 Tax=Linum tenue TaxID=586396 RepID=A0AAV0KPN3_9ROSI|nr:unnamed protein product [Linum tenue]
MAKGDILLQFS